MVRDVLLGRSAGVPTKSLPSHSDPEIRWLYYQHGVNQGWAIRDLQISKGHWVKNRGRRSWLFGVRGKFCS
eukprot:116579-Pelagomonas_calceolata.AAC.4